jgi:hypothetical protein
MAAAVANQFLQGHVERTPGIIFFLPAIVAETIRIRNPAC